VNLIDINTCQGLNERESHDVDENTTMMAACSAFVAMAFENGVHLP